MIGSMMWAPLAEAGDWLFVGNSYTDFKAPEASAPRRSHAHEDPTRARRRETPHRIDVLFVAL